MGKVFQCGIVDLPWLFAVKEMFGVRDVNVDVEGGDSIWYNLTSA